MRGEMPRWDGTVTASTTSIPASANVTSSSEARRSNGTVTIYVDLTTTAALAAGASAAVVPDGFRPPRGAYFWAADANTGAQVLMLLDTTGVLSHVLARNSATRTLGALTFVQ